MTNKKDNPFKLILDILLRQKKIIGCSLIICTVAGLGVYLKTPKKYEATALIKYEQQRINPSAMSPDVKDQLKEIVSTVSQQITSRTSLEEIITRFDLYRNLREKLPMEDVVATMREKAIKWAPAGSGQIFMVSYKGRDPKTVMLVTNAIAAKFVEENIRFREERVTETSAYVKEELRMAKEALDKKDEVMRDYKLKYYNELPQQSSSNMSRLNALQTQYQDNQSNIQNLEQTRVMIQEQIGLRKEAIAKMMQQVPGNLTDRTVLYKSQDPVADLAQMKLDLDALRARYTENHPEIKRLKNLIQQREESLQNLPTVQHENSDKGGAPAPSSDPQLQQLQRQLQEIENNIANLRKEKVTIHNDITKYENWVEAAPFREAEWSSLTRDYDQLNKHYNTLVAQSLAAESAESLERSQKGSQFKIVDPAHFPEKPVQPDFIRIIFLALLLGLASGAGISYTIEMLDTSFKEAGEIESYLGLPVACSIPIIYTNKERLKKKIQSIIWALAFVVPSLVLVVGIIYLYQKGMIII